MNEAVQSGVPHTEYYAPAFRVEIDGEQLSPQTNGDVINLKVKMDMDNMTSFDLTVANWDDLTDEVMGPKYSDSSTFDIGRQVHIKMGYADRLISMVTGQITSMAPKFPQQGPSTLTISGLDGMFALKDRRPQNGEETSYRNRTDWEIAQIIAGRNGLDVHVDEIGPTHTEVVQKNQDDAQFLMERAKRIDFDCFVLTDPETARSTLYFIRPTDGRNASRIRTFSLRWGKNLLSFMPTINVSEQVNSVTVRGWNRVTKQAFVETAGPDDLPSTTGGTRSGPSVSGQSQRKTSVVVDAPVTSAEEARNLAISLLTERAYRYIKATGQIIGLPDLRPGDNLALSGLGGRFNGDYYIKKVEHSIDNSGYKTQFEARRMYEGERTEAESGGTNV